MKTVFAFLSALVLSCTLVKAQWSALNSNTPYNIHTLHILSASEIVCAGSEVIKTSDAGNTWTVYPLLDNFNNPIYSSVFLDLHFFNSATGVATGAITTSNSEVIFRTTDGGLHWTSVSINNSGAWPRQLNDIDFPTGTTGYAVGTNGRILKSTDAGATWIPLSSGTAAELTAVKFTSATTGYVTGNNIILKTTDGGSTWQSIPAAAYLMSLSFANDSTAYTCGGGEIIFTDDHGATWITLQEPFSSTNAIYALNSDTVYVAADNGLYITRDGGDYWEVFPSPANGMLRDIGFVNATTGYVAGDNGKILRTTNGGGASIPMPAFTSSVANVCGSSTVTLTNTSSPGYSFQWLYNNSVFSTTYNAAYTFTNPSNTGTFALVASNGSFSDTVYSSFTVNVDQPITANAGQDLSLCYNEQGQLSATGGTSYTWFPATGLNSTAIANPVVTSTGTTTYVVTATTGTCTDTDTVTVFTQPSIANDTWAPVLNSSTVGSVMSIDFVNANTGFGVTDNAQCVRTTDGGATWSTVSAFPWNQFDCAVDFVDPWVGYIANNSFYKSTDGGVTFTAINTGYPWMNEVAFINRDTGWAISGGNAFGDPKYIIKTTDGGVSWTMQYTITGTPGLNGLYCLNKDTAFCVGGYVNSTIILRTTDGGQNWVQMPVPVNNAELYDVEFSTPLKGYAVGSGHALRTTDGGSTWIDYILPADLFTVEFISPDSGYAGASNGRIYKTVNGGQCWQNMGSLGSQSIRDISFPVPQVGYLGRSALSSFTQKILKTGQGTHNSFTLSGNVICAGDTLLASNGAYGYTSYQWLLDGTPVSSSMNTSMILNSPGIHTVSLVATVNTTSDTVTQTITVVAPPAAPTTPAGSAFICAGSMTTTHTTAGAPGAVSYNWYVTPTWAGYATGNGSTVTVNWMNGFTGTGYVSVAAVNAAGCEGPLSPADTVSFLQWPPTPQTPSGPPALICLPITGTHTTTYTIPRVNNPYITSYAWDLGPVNAGTIAGTDTFCVITWNSSFSGYAYIKVAAVNACNNTGAYSNNKTSIIERMPDITTQPVSQAKQPGQNVTFSVVATPASLVTGYQWKKNSISIAGATSSSYTKNNLTLADSGYYHCSVYTLNCGAVESDSAYLTMNTSVGISEHAGITGSVYPNPVTDKLEFYVTGADGEVIVEVKNLLGQEIASKMFAIQREVKGSIEMSSYPAGTYYVLIRSKESVRTFRIVKQ